jgi:hypothetical protein
MFGIRQTEHQIPRTIPNKLWVNFEFTRSLEKKMIKYTTDIVWKYSVDNQFGG